MSGDPRVEALAEAAKVLAPPPPPRRPRRGCLFTAATPAALLLAMSAVPVASLVSKTAALAVLSTALGLAGGVVAALLTCRVVERRRT